MFKRVSETKETKELSRYEKALALEATMADIGKIKLINEAITNLKNKAIKRVGDNYASLTTYRSQVKVYDSGEIFIKLVSREGVDFITAEWGYGHYGNPCYKENRIKFDTETLLTALNTIDIINLFLKFSQDAENNICNQVI